MHIKLILKGERAPEGWDRVRVERTQSGKFEASGEIAHEGGAMFTRTVFDTREEAEKAVKQWALEQGSEIVYLETDRG